MIAFSAIDIATISYPGGGSSTGRFWSIYVVDSDGSNLRRLTRDDLHDCTSPQWSPDGKRILFTSSPRILQPSADEQKERPILHYLIDADGSNLRSIPILPGGSRWCWWTAGRLYALSSNSDGHFIAFLDLGRSGTTRLPIPSGYKYLDLSRDGKHFLLVKQDRIYGEDGAHLPGGRWLYSVSVDGNEIRPLIEDGHDYSRNWRVLSWSPDSRRIAYWADDENGDLNLYVMDSHGFYPRKLGPIWFEYDLHWSPNSRYVAYISFDGSYRLNVAEVESGIVRDLGSLTEEDGSGEIIAPEPAWSPDSSQLIFSQFGADGQFYLYRIEPDGSGRHPIFKNQPRFDVLYYLAWGKDT